MKLIDLLFQVDTRSLQCFRLCTCLFTLYSWAEHVWYAQLYHTNNGLYNSYDLDESGNYVSLWMHSIHSFWFYRGETVIMQKFLFMTQAIVCMNLCIGFHCTMSSLLHFVWIVSVHGRNPYILDTSDQFFKYLSLWMILLPIQHSGMNIYHTKKTKTKSDMKTSDDNMFRKPALHTSSLMIPTIDYVQSDGYKAILLSPFKKKLLHYLHYSHQQAMQSYNSEKKQNSKQKKEKSKDNKKKKTSLRKRKKRCENVRKQK